MERPADTNRLDTEVIIPLKYLINFWRSLDTEVFIPLKYLSNFWRFLDLILINCEVELDLRCSENCIISETYRTPEEDANSKADPSTDFVPLALTTIATFKINSTKIYVQV